LWGAVAHFQRPPPLFQGFGPCGRWLAANGQAFAVSTGKPVWVPSAGEGWEMWKQSTSTFSPDSRLLCGRVSVSSSAKKEDFERGEHDVWEVTSGKRLVRLQAQQLESVKVSCHMPTLLGPGPPMKSMPKAGAFTGYSPASVCGAWFL